MDTHQQITRRDNLRHLVAQLADEGVTRRRGQARALGIPWRVLNALLTGDVIDDGMARDLEWTVQRRLGWMDEDRRIADA